MAGFKAKTPAIFIGSASHEQAGHLFCMYHANLLLTGKIYL